jgi:hypothetical protein
VQHVITTLVVGHGQPVTPLALVDPNLRGALTLRVMYSTKSTHMPCEDKDLTVS